MLRSMSHRFPEQIDDLQSLLLCEIHRLCCAAFMLDIIIADAVIRGMFDQLCVPASHALFIMVLRGIFHSIGALQNDTEFILLLCCPAVCLFLV